MDGDWVIIIYGNGDEILKNSPKLYVNDNTEQDLIEQYDEMLAERMEGDNED